MDRRGYIALQLHYNFSKNLVMTAIPDYQWGLRDSTGVTGAAATTGTALPFSFDSDHREKSFLGALPMYSSHHGPTPLHPSMIPLY